MGALFLIWLQTPVEAGDAINEYEASRKLHEFRSEYRGLPWREFRDDFGLWSERRSASLCHAGGRAPLRSMRKDFTLCHSGGQYLFGTTDITRTVPLGPCSQLEKEDYTLVLKGHIALAKAVFLKGRLVASWMSWPANRSGAQSAISATEPATGSDPSECPRRGRRTSGRTSIVRL